MQGDPFGWGGHTVAGKLRVEAFIAEGGFGVVYRAAPSRRAYLRSPPRRRRETMASIGHIAVGMAAEPRTRPMKGRRAVRPPNG
jgi:hypothetical protein